MAEHILEYIVTTKYDRHSVKSILTQELGLARQVLTRLKRSGEVLINGDPCYLRDMAFVGDILTVIMREELEQDIPPEDIPLNIVFEDEHLLIVDKLPGLVVHPTKGYTSGTLANAVIHHWRVAKQDYVFRPVHRLDRDTSGLVVIAKNPFAQEALTMQHQTREWRKFYIAIACGEMTEPRGAIDAPIARVGNGSRARMISSDGQEALTLWEIVRLLPGATLVRAELVTGRTHQIRVHLAHIGHPLLGDEVYGTFSSVIKRQALHAAELQFTHPVSKEIMVISCPLPTDMENAIEHLSLLSAER